MSRTADADRGLCRTIEAQARRAGCAARVVASAAATWSSPTFAGSRHALKIEAADDVRLGNWLDGLSRAEFAVPGHLIADLAVTGVTRAGGTAAIAIEALSVECG